MEPFSDQKFEKRLQNLKDTQESIQSLSSWCLQYKSHAPSIVKHWLRAVKKAKISQRLVLFYLANDVLQHSRRKQLHGFLSHWLSAFRDAIPLVRDEKVQKQVTRMMTIWDERNVYKSEEVEELKALLMEPEKNEPPIDFDPPILFQKLQEFQKIEEETDKRQKRLSEAPVNITMDSESLRTVLKERGQSDNVLGELNDSVQRMEAVVDALSTEVGKRIALITLLQQANLFYNHQRSEAKVVCSAYKSFAHRVKQVKHELTDEWIESLPEDVRTPSPPPLPPVESDNSLDSRLLNINAMFGGGNVQHASQPAEVDNSLESRISNLNAMFEGGSVPPLPPTVPTHSLPFFPSILPQITIPDNLLNIFSTVKTMAPPPPPPTETHYDEHSYNYGPISEENDHINMGDHSTENLYNPYDINIDFTEEMGELDFLDGDTDMRQKEKPTSRRDNINTNNLISLTSRGDDSPQRLLKTLDLTALTSLRQKLKSALKKEVGGADLNALDMELSEEEEEMKQKSSSPVAPVQEDFGDFNYRQDVDFRQSHFGESDRDMRPPDIDFRKPPPESDFQPPNTDLDFRQHHPGHFGSNFGTPPDFDFRQPLDFNNYQQQPPGFLQPPDFHFHPSRDSEFGPNPDFLDRSVLNFDFERMGGGEFRHSPDVDLRQKPDVDFRQQQQPPNLEYRQPPPDCRPDLAQQFSVESGNHNGSSNSQQFSPEGVENPDFDFFANNGDSDDRRGSQNMPDMGRPPPFSMPPTPEDSGASSFSFAGRNSPFNPGNTNFKVEDRTPPFTPNQSPFAPNQPPFSPSQGPRPRFGAMDSTSRMLRPNYSSDDSSPRPGQGMPGPRHRFEAPNEKDITSPGPFGPRPNTPRTPRPDFHHRNPRPDFQPRTPRPDFNRPSQDFGHDHGPRTPNADGFRPRFPQRDSGPTWRPPGLNNEENHGRIPRFDGPKPLMSMDMSAHHDLETSPEMERFDQDDQFNESRGPSDQDFVSSGPRPFFSELHVPHRNKPPNAFRSPRGFNPRFGPRFRGGPRF